LKQCLVEQGLQFDLVQQRTFQQGLNEYAGVTDTWINSDDPNLNFNGETKKHGSNLRQSSYQILIKCRDFCGYSLHLRAMAIVLLKPEVGLSVEEYIQSFLESFASLDEEFSYDSLTPEQWTKEFEEWLDSHDYITAPPLTDEAVSRESIYCEREGSQS